MNCGLSGSSVHGYIPSLTHDFLVCTEIMISFCFLVGFFFLIYFFGCMWDLSSLTRDWTPAQEAQSLNHWTTWKVPYHHSFRITGKINQGKDPELSKQWWGKGQSWRRSPPRLQSTMVDWKIFQWTILEKGSLRDTIQMPRIHSCSRDLTQLVISWII